MKPNGMIQFGTMKHNPQERNPFRYGCVVEDIFYCPRPALERQLAGFIRSGQNVVIHGERRMGKTSLINAVVRGMRGWRMIYVDLLHVQTVGDVCRRIVSSVRNMERKASVFEKALKLLPRLRPVLKVDPATGEFGFGFDARAAEDPYAVEEVLDMLAKVAAGGRTVVVFDEFQDVCNLPDAQTVLALMRGRIQFQGGIPYVFTGSVRNRMVDMFDNPTAPSTSPRSPCASARSTGIRSRSSSAAVSKAGIGVSPTRRSGRSWTRSRTFRATSSSCARRSGK